MTFRTFAKVAGTCGVRDDGEVTGRRGVLPRVAALPTWRGRRHDGPWMGGCVRWARSSTGRKQAANKPAGKAPTTTLIVNTDTAGHEHTLLGLFNGAKRLDCVVAFAKLSGLALVRKALKGALASGLTARFVGRTRLLHDRPLVLPGTPGLRGPSTPCPCSSDWRDRGPPSIRRSMRSGTRGGAWWSRDRRTLRPGD